MKRLNLFWRFLEERPSAAAIRCVWREFLGEELPWVEPWLRPTGKISPTYPHPCGCGLPHRVVFHAPDRIVAVCPESLGDRISLTRAELVVYEADLSALCVALAGALGLEVSCDAVEAAPRTYLLGNDVPLSGYRFPVFLSLPAEKEDLPRAVERLIVSHPDPFILIAPTRNLLPTRTAVLLKERRCVFLAASESFGWIAAGKPALTDAAKGVISNFHRALLPDTREKPRVEFFPTPAGCRWSDVAIRFTDGHVVSVRAGQAGGVYHYTQMGMVNRKNGSPTLQWELLRVFAEENGLLTWSSREADRKNQKRKENLAADLKAFFRIEGDPFVPEENGWRAVFHVSAGA